MGKKYPVGTVCDAIRERHGISNRLAAGAFCCAFYDMFGREPLVGDVVAKRDVDKLMALAESYLEPS